MLWKSGRRSSNVEDRRRLRVPGGKKSGGIGILLLVLVGMYFGIDPALIMNVAGDVQQGTTSTTTGPAHTPQEQQLADFVSVVLADTEDTWNKIFKEKGGTYREPKLVLFSGNVKSACGFAQAAMGPFYCPADQQVYIDLSFYQDLKDQLDAPGDFAQAYVIAHEIGHHVQKLIGISDKVHEVRQQLSDKEYNKISVKVELQADCFAGIWANHADRVRNIVEEGDIEEALNAASHIGDDRLQQQSRGYVTPDSFTHGSSKQRVRWFKVGYTQGTLDSCDTFSARSL
jgi:uncharacterized protein